MSSLTGGMHVYSTDRIESNGLIEAFSALTSGNAPLSEISLQLESKGEKLTINKWINGTVIIDSTVGRDTFFLITWKQARPSISIWDPEGTEMKNFTDDKTSRMVYLSIPGIAKTGTWTYSLQAKAMEEILTITVNSRAANPSVPPITVTAKINQDNITFPNPVVVYAEVVEGLTPILGAKVTAFIEVDGGNTTLELLDNGAGADSIENDGVYSRYFMNFSKDGRYNLKVQVRRGANSMRRLRHSPNAAAYIPGWVVNGEIQGNPPRPEIDEDIQTNVEDFSRTANGGAFVLSNIPDNFTSSSADYFPPSQITNLEATRNENIITLTWTAPGDDFDVGKVQEYIIKMSGNILDLKENFDCALQVNTTDLKPKEVNSKEIFTFEPKNVTEENATHIFFAIRSVDDGNHTSEISNIAQVPLFIPQADNNPEENHPSSGISISTVVLVVFGTVVTVSIIVGISIYFSTRKRPSTGF